MAAPSGLLVNPFFNRSVHDDVASAGAPDAAAGAAGARLVAPVPLSGAASVGPGEVEGAAPEVNAVAPPAATGVLVLMPDVSCEKLGPAPDPLKTGALLP